MTTIQLPYDTTTIPLGRNAKHGHLQVDLSRFAPQVQEHIFAYGLRQIINDAIANGGDDLQAKAEKRLDRLYEGHIRVANGAAAEANPVEAEAQHLAKAALVKTAKKSEAWKAVPKELRKKDDGIVHALNATHSVERTLPEWIVYTLEKKPEIMKSAERIVRERARADDIDL